MNQANTATRSVQPDGNGNGNGKKKDPCGAVLVCGGGIAGIQAAIDLSAAGFRVHLVEQSPTIGGGMARLDKTFPTNDCATCIISPKLVECMRDHNIDVLTMADVMALDGEAGNFKATVRRRPRSVDASKCTGCGDCWQHCPVRYIAKPTAPFDPYQKLDSEDAAQLDEVLARHQGDRGALMPVLQDIGRRYGYLPRLILEHISARMEIPLADILRVVSFYHEFRLEPAARHTVQVCSGTSCYSRGSKALLDRLEAELGIRAGETDKDGRFTLQTVRCLGLCALSPAMKIDDISVGRVNLDRIPEILEPFK